MKNQCRLAAWPASRRPAAGGPSDAPRTARRKARTARGAAPRGLHEASEGGDDETRNAANYECGVARLTLASAPRGAGRREVAVYVRNSVARTP